MDQKRILIFSLAYRPFIGGAEVAVKEITDRLPGYEFEMITANLDGQQEKIERLGNILVRRMASKYLFPFAACRLAVRLHRIKSYDAVWAIMANQAGIAAALFKRQCLTVPLLLTLQEGDDLNSLAYRLRLIAPKLFKVFRRADQIQAISNYLANWAQKMGATCPITIVPNGVDVEKFKTQNEKRKTTEQNLKTIITTSRLVKKNGVDILIEAMKYLSGNVKLQILGTGPEKTSLKKLTSRFNLDDRVEFLGQVSPEEVPNYLTQADVFVRSSRSEGLGNSFLEAMAAGVPVVGTPVGGIPDFLTEGKTGWLCQVDNPNNLAEKVKYVLNSANYSQVDQVIVNAKNLIQEKYNWVNVSQKMAQIIAKLT